MVGINSPVEVVWVKGWRYNNYYKVGHVGRTDARA